MSTKLSKKILAANLLALAAADAATDDDHRAGERLHPRRILVSSIRATSRPISRKR